MSKMLQSVNRLNKLDLNDNDNDDYANIKVEEEKEEEFMLGCTN